VAEVGDAPAGDQLFHILYDGTVMDEKRFSVLGGDADTIATRMEATFQDGSTMVDALRSAVAALAGPDRQLVADDLEVAVLGRSNGRRRFRRLADAEVAALLLSEASEPATASEPAAPSESAEPGETTDT
jgi:proteasome alpha subunit